MGFFDALQKQNLFTDQNPNPIQMPSAPDWDPVGTFRSLFPLVQAEKEKDRQLKLRLAGMGGSVPGGGSSMMANVRPFQAQRPALIPQPGETQNVVFDRRGDSADTFANNILNPPERGFKFQELAQKNDLANRGLDIKEGNQGIQQQRANISGYSAETRRRLQELHDMTDSEKLAAVQNGQYTLEEMKAASAMGNIKERGSQNRQTEGVRGENTLAAIRARTAGSKEINAAKPDKPISNTQVRAGENLAARKLADENPDLAKYIELDPAGNYSIVGNPDLVTLSRINGAIHGGKGNVGGGDIKLPKDNSSSSSPSMDDNKAIEALKAHGLPVTPENIKKAKDPANWKK